MQLGWIFKGLQVAGTLATKVPAIIADGKVTVDEMVDLTTTILTIFEVPVSFEVPDELRAMTIGAKLNA